MVYKTARRIVIAVIGGTVLLLGLVMAVPGVLGPGFLVIPLGLSILATEFVWARVWLQKFRAGAANIGNRFRRKRSATPLPAPCEPADRPAPSAPERPALTHPDA